MRHVQLRPILFAALLAFASGCPAPTEGGLKPTTPRSAKPKVNAPPSALPSLATLSPAPSPSPTNADTGESPSPSTLPSTTASSIPSAVPSKVPSKAPSVPPSPATDAVITFAGGTQGLAEGTGTNARFNSPNGIDVDAQGNVYVADAGNHRIRKITPAGVVSTFAGTDQGLLNGPAGSAKFNSPYGVAVGTDNTVYVADTGNHVIRRISADGEVSTLAGGDEGFANGTGADARFRSPFSLAVDAFGMLFVADAGNHAIRMITPAGLASTVVANGSGFVDGGFSVAKLFVPNDVGIDLAGRLVVADFNNHAIRAVDRSKTTVETLIGEGTPGNQDGAKGTATLSSPTGLVISKDGIVWIADNQNHRLRVLEPNGELKTLTGSASGLKNGALETAMFNEPTDLAIDKDGNLYVADTGNNLIRRVRPN